MPEAEAVRKLQPWWEQAVTAVWQGSIVLADLDREHRLGFNQEAESSGSGSESGHRAELQVYGSLQDIILQSVRRKWGGLWAPGLAGVGWCWLVF